MIKTAQVYDYVNGLTPRRTPHNLSYQTTFTGELGEIYPNYWEMCNPGDKVTLDVENLIRINPQLAPLMHQIEVKVRWFFVPLRLLWRGEKWYNKWEVWVTGAVDGTELTKYNEMNPDDKVEYPNIDEMAWNPYESVGRSGKIYRATGTDKYKAIGAEVGKIWENAGLPYAKQIKAEPKMKNRPNKWIKRAYNKTWNDWYRDENLQKPVHLDNDNILKTNWERDYFVSAGYEQQKGQAPKIGLTMLKHEWEGQVNLTNNKVIKPSKEASGKFFPGDTDNTGISGFPTGAITERVDGQMRLADHNGINFSVSDLRALIAVQKALEMDMRAGTRYIEFLQANFNVHPRDERLQMAEYIGESSQMMQMTEVLTTADQTQAGTGVVGTGQMAGHSVSQSRGGKRKKFFAQEHGILLGTICVVPKAQYQQGVPRQLFYKDKYEVYRPQFAYLSEQEIPSRELYYTGEDEDEEIFGYQGRWDEQRIRSNLVMGLMRTDVDQNLSYWNLARSFENRPKLNDDFITMRPRKDYLQIPSQPALILTVGWHAYFERMIPATSDPGLLDHVYGEGSGNNKVARGGRRF